MPHLVNRTRLVTCRLSVEDHQALSECCATARVRSVSEFIRQTVLEKIELLKLPGRSIHTDLSRLTVRLQQLEHLLGDVNHLISMILGERTTQVAEECPSGDKVE
jgi:hypothetical protein